MGKSDVYASIVRSLPIVPFLSFGLVLAWSQFANNAYGLIDSLAAFGEGYRFANMASTLANAVALLVAACCGRRADELLLSPRFGLLCGAVASGASVGALLVSMGAVGAAGQAQVAVLCALFAVAGASTGLLFIQIGTLYGRLIGRRAVFNLAWSHLLCGALFFIAVGMAHWRLGQSGNMLLPALFYCAFPLLAAWLCSMALDVKPCNEQEYSADVRDIPAVFWKFVVVILVLCFAMSLTGAVAQGTTGVDGPIVKTRTNNFLRLVIALLLMMSVVFAKREQFELGRAYTFIMISSVAVATMAPVMDGEVAGWPQLSTMVLLVFRMLHWVVLSLIVYQKKISPVLVFGFGCGVQALGNGLGLLTGFIFHDALVSSSARLAMSIGFTLLIILCAFALFSEKSFDRLFEQRSDDELDLSQLFAPLPVFASAESDSGAAAAQTPAGEARGSVPEAEGRAGEEPPGSEGALPSYFSLAIEALSRQSSLSKRETEVFRLIAMGYNPQTISEKLCISWNTVRGHARNIYAKLGVHSHQELIALVDSQKEKLRDRP